MNQKIVEYAQIYSQKGFSVIPVDENKQPAIYEWYKYQTRPMTPEEVVKYFSQENVHGIGLLTGGKMGITGLDFDLKYDLTEDLLSQYKVKIPKALLKKLLVHTTKNKGYHFIFQCDVVEGNQKLAQRETTDAEVEALYLSRKGELGAKKAMEEALRDKIRVLIETRGGEPDKCGGYVIIPPTEGYTKVCGKLQKITPDEYEILMNAAREFNEYVSRSKKLASQQQGLSKDGNSPFDNFNENGNVLSILLQNGWTEVRSHARDIRLKRPGQTHSKSSALYDTNSNLLNVFTTSSEFEVGAHTPSDVFIQLECNGDAKEAYHKLIELGYTDDRKNNK